MPKALLPVGNQPMISYQLAWLEDSGVTGQYASRRWSCCNMIYNRTSL